METVEENEPNVLGEITNDEELAQIPRELVKKIQLHFNAKCDEFITAKAVFESSRKNLGKLWLSSNFVFFLVHTYANDTLILFKIYTYSSLSYSFSFFFTSILKFLKKLKYQSLSRKYITLKVFYIKKCLNKICWFTEQNLEEAQKELAEHKVNLEEYRGKFELTEKFSAELSSNLEETKNEVHKLQESVQR